MNSRFATMLGTGTVKHTAHRDYISLILIAALVIGFKFRKKMVLPTIFKRTVYRSSRCRHPLYRLWNGFVEFIFFRIKYAPRIPVGKKGSDLSFYGSNTLWGVTFCQKNRNSHHRFCINRGHHRNHNVVDFLFGFFAADAKKAKNDDKQTKCSLFFIGGHCRKFWTNIHDVGSAYGEGHHCNTTGGYHTGICIVNDIYLFKKKWKTECGGCAGYDRYCNRCCDLGHTGVGGIVSAN